MTTIQQTCQVSHEQHHWGDILLETTRRLNETQGLTKLVGQAPVFLDAITAISSVARSHAAALICGETGTGKELAARAIHYLSNRSSYPFISINCGSLPETLLEDELFGHERGAFTDAHSRRLGLIAQADKGTLFLDEVDTLSAKAQVSLLRVLQDKKFRAIGSNLERQADVRIIAATNARLESLVHEGRFRADLYYRLCIFTIFLPPLRQRREDITILAEHFLTKHSVPDMNSPHLSQAALTALCSYDWPGNVRELENAIIRGIYLSRSQTIEAGDLGIFGNDDFHSASATLSQTETHLQPLSFKARKQAVIESFERKYLMQLMTEHQGNISQAARAAGKERRDLGKMLKKYQIDPNNFRNGKNYLQH